MEAITSIVGSLLKHSAQRLDLPASLKVEVRTRSDERRVRINLKAMGGGGPTRKLPARVPRQRRRKLTSNIPAGFACRALFPFLDQLLLLISYLQRNILEGHINLILGLNSTT